MKPQPKAEAERWLAQARSEVAFARVGVREGFFAQACFHCQQSAEMALKALHYLGGARLVVGHSLVELLAPLTERYPVLAGLRAAAARLDQLYIPTRSPNGLPGGVPAEVFSKEQAEEAARQATEFIERVAELTR
ncbi:MAG: HEPN domain-containing protein [Candidatus Rokubacteria bacterium]|nr:HEPN domain-containing protein [Candidatus Rokubacteria bacterium]